MRYRIILIGVLSLELFCWPTITDQIFEKLVDFQRMPQYKPFLFDLKPIDGIDIVATHIPSQQIEPIEIELTIEDVKHRRDGDSLHDFLLAIAQEKCAAEPIPLDESTDLQMVMQARKRLFIFKTRISSELFERYKQQCIKKFEKECPSEPTINLASRLAEIAEVKNWLRSGRTPLQNGFYYFESQGTFN